MPYLPTTQPLVEPITLAEVKEFLKIETSDEDTLLTSLITSARLYTESKLNRKLITQNWTLLLDAMPYGKTLEFTCAPIQSVIHVQLYDAMGIPTILDPENYEVDLVSHPARLVRKTLTWSQPEKCVNGVEILLKLGYGDTPADVPEPIRHALRLLVAHWYMRREPVILEEQVIYVPETYASLIAPYKLVRL